MTLKIPQYQGVPRPRGRSTPAGLAAAVSTALTAVLLAACSDAPTTPAANVDGTRRPVLAKSSRPVPAIAFSLTGAAGRNVFVVDTGGTRLDQVTSGTLDDEPAWSPDRRKIAFVRGDGPARPIYVRPLTGGRETALGLGFQPSWSPDGQEIAFARLAEGNVDVYVMKADGSEVRRLTTDPAADYEPHWSANGLAIAFTSTRAGGGEIFVMDRDGGGLTQRTFCGPSYFCISPKLSPVIGDYRMLFYQGTYGGGGVPVISAIRIMDASGAIVLDFNSDQIVVGKPTWSPDGQRFGFLGYMPTGGPTRVIHTAKTNGTDWHYFPSPDGSDAGAPAWAR